MGNLHVALIVQLIYAAVENDLQTIQLGNCTFFFITQLVDQLSQTIVVIEISLVVSHV